MTTTISFVPLYGCFREGPTCSLLIIDDVTILLDCGWDERLNKDFIEPLRSYARKVNLVLISHPDFEHVGALPYAYKVFGLSAPIYITQTTKTMANLQFKDFIKMRNYYENFDLFTLDDVDRVFQLMKSATYEQINLIRGRSTTTIISHNAGRVLGSAIWEINYELEKIIYALDFELERSEINTTVNPEIFRNTTLFITDSMWDPNMTKAKMNDTKLNLYETIANALRAPGTPIVLIPQNSCGRTLPLLITLLQLWKERRWGRVYGLVFFSPHAQIIWETAKNIINSADIQNEIKSLDSYDYIFNYDKDIDIIIFETMDRMLNYIYGDDKIYTKENLKPLVILTPSLGLDTGYSQKILTYCGANPNNMLLFTERPPSDTLASLILRNPDQRQYSYVKRNREYLSPAELKLYYKNKLTNSHNDKMESSEDSAMSDNDTDIINNELKYGKYTIPQYEMFDAMDDNEEYDDYGIVIDPQLYAKNIINYKEQDKIVNVSIDDRPSKTSEKQSTLQLNCYIKQILIEGRCIGSVISDTMKLYLPSRIILIHGSEANTLNCAEHLRKSLAYYKNIIINTPRDLESIEIKAPIITKVSLNADLQSYHSTKLNGFTFYKLNGHLTDKENEDLKEFSIDTSQVSSSSVLIREKELRVAELIKKLEGFVKVNDGGKSSGKLVCIRGDDEIILKIEKGKISLEGLASLLYDDVKEIIQKQFESI